MSVGQNIMVRQAVLCSPVMSHLGLAHQRRGPLANKTNKSVLWSHCVSEHTGQEAAFTMKASGYFVDPLSRQINEAVRIRNSTNTMNRRGEWKKTAVFQARFIRD